MQSAKLKELLARIRELQTELSSAVDSENWDRLGELDLGCRELFEGVHPDQFPTNEQAELVGELEQFVAFHRSVREACIRQQHVSVDQLEQLRGARQAADVYGEIGRRRVD